LTHIINGSQSFILSPMFVCKLKQTADILATSNVLSWLWKIIMISREQHHN